MAVEASAPDGERITRVEQRMDDLATRTDTRIGRLEGEYKHLATKRDIEQLRGEMAGFRGEMDGLRGELRGMKAALWAIGAFIGLMEVLGRLGV